MTEVFGSNSEAEVKDRGYVGLAFSTYGAVSALLEKWSSI